MADETLDSPNGQEALSSDAAKVDSGDAEPTRDSGGTDAQRQHGASDRDPRDAGTNGAAVVHKSLRYHAKRRAFFDGLHRMTMAIAAMGGSVAFVAIIGERTNIAGVAAIVLAISTALDLVVGYSGRARKHDNLYRRYSNLAAEIAKTGSPTGEQVRLWRGERLLIEKDEPTVKGVLSVRCHNEEAEARNYGEEHQYRVRWYQYLFAQLISLPPNKFARKPGRRS